jgi:hypothetical protein
MKQPKPFILVFLLIVVLSKTLMAQNADPTKIKAAQLKVIVIPYARPGEALKTKLETDNSLRGAIVQINTGFNERGFITQDFDATLKAISNSLIANAKTQSDAKNALIGYSGADIYVEVDINAVSAQDGNSVTVLLTAYDAATSSPYFNITCDSRKHYNEDNATLISAALQLPIPPKPFTDDIVKSTIPCLDDFLNNLQAKLTDSVIKNIVDKRNAKIAADNQKTCQVFTAKADNELLRHHYDEAINILLTITPENGCYNEAQKKVEDIFKQQYGSLDKAVEVYKKRFVLNPGNEDIRRNLNLINKLIDIRNENDKTPPQIILKTPQIINGHSVAADVTGKGEIYVSGFVKDLSDVTSVSVNGKTITDLQPGGFFSIYIDKNTADIKIEAFDKKGANTSETFSITSKVADSRGSSDDEIAPIAADERYHAIFIANSNYKSAKWPALNTTVAEARSLRQMFIDKYNFNAADVDTIFNKSKKEILTAVSNRVDQLSSNDNLVIFYGGHGYFVESTNMAYWVPLGAEDKIDYVSNTEIKDLIAGCKAHHILIMADACFSGAMRGGMEAPAKYEYKFNSRQLLTSGGSEPVPGKSAYVQMILKSLTDNTNKYLSARQLYGLIFTGINAQTGTEPTLRDMQVAGSEGGQFYFKKR